MIWEGEHFSAAYGTSDYPLTAQAHILVGGHETPLPEDARFYHGFSERKTWKSSTLDPFVTPRPMASPVAESATEACPLLVVKVRVR